MPLDRLPSLQHKLLLQLYVVGTTDARYRKPYDQLVAGGFAGASPGFRYRWYVTQKGKTYCETHRDPTPEKD